MSREHPLLVEKCVIADLMKEIWKERVSVAAAAASNRRGVSESVLFRPQKRHYSARLKER